MSKMKLRRASCPLCGSATGKVVRFLDAPDGSGVFFFECTDCNFIFADPAVLEQMDGGLPVMRYQEDYWKMELAAARERSFRL